MTREKETCDSCVMLTNGACRSRYECDGKKKDFIPLFPDCIFDPKYVIPHGCEQVYKDLSDFDNIARAISHVKATGKEAEVYDVIIITKEEYERLKEAEKIPKRMYQYLDRRLDCGVPNGNVLWDCAKKFDIKVKAPWQSCK